MKINLRMRDCWRGFSKKEIIVCFLEGAAFVIIFGYFFYKSVVWTILLAPLSWPIARHKAEDIKRKKKRELLLQFRELIVSVNGFLQAGYSMENSFREAYGDMNELYGKNSEIVKELSKINRGMENNAVLTELLLAFAIKTELDEIENFAEVLSVGKNSGGNLLEIMSSYVKMIDEKMEVFQEIETMVAARKYEQKIMNMIPFIILLYMELTSKGFFSMLYHNILGNIVMTISLGLYLVAVYMSEKIVNINV